MKEIVEEVFLRIAIDEDEDEEEEEMFIEDCNEVFGDEWLEEGYEYNLNQYECLLIKSMKMCLRNGLFVLIIVLIPLIVEFVVDEKGKVGLIEYSFDDWTHLKENNVYIGYSSSRFDEEMINRISSVMKQRSPKTSLIFLSNLSDVEELNDYLWGIFGDR